LGGLLLTALGAGLTLWFSASWYVLSLVALLPLWRRGSQPRLTPDGSRVVGDLIDGFRIALGHREMAAVLTVSLAANICVWPVYQAFMPVFAEDVLHSGAGGLGVLLTASGVGAVVGSFAIAALGDFSRKGLLFLVSTGGFGLFFALFALTQSMGTAVVLITFVGVGSAGFGVMQSTLLLLLAPEEARGRVMGVQVLAIGVRPLATLLQGAAATVIGVPATTTIVGLALVVAMLGVGIAVPTLRTLR
jgi:predicted MFS family arabinose efflux permease